EARPQVITLYFEQVDEASHRYGPGSAECVAAIARVDGWIGELLDGIEKMGLGAELHIAVVSDHGQGEYRRDAEPLVLSDFLDLEGVTIVESGAFAMLYLDEQDLFRAIQIRDEVNARWNNGHAWLQKEAPAFWQVSSSRRFGDVLLQADPGFAVLSTREQQKKMTPGDHGWSPNMRDMHGIFLVAGPRLPAGRRIATIRATDAYPLLLELIGLPDGREQPPASPLCDLLEAKAACKTAQADSPGPR
ncbi:MAG: alkaline phosphatase family protein, partial [Halioglobus sp.]|nr:alkaline phosphatase family protein [Halioglobus sp.]